EGAKDTKDKDDDAKSGDAGASAKAGKDKPSAGNGAKAKPVADSKKTAQPKANGKNDSGAKD
ncbi:MAG: hypothetical protein ACXVIO_01715, partial [Candidatus Angelobacter sp.]